mmetsp:Transcript_49657/g.99649  ORF Transcript_49657/g.99649 Transcript_49657/m.99649 type:complete len:207 (-) Transcript_49657:137-757(-)
MDPQPIASSAIPRAEANSCESIEEKVKKAAPLRAITLRPRTNRGSDLYGNKITVTLEQLEQLYCLPIKEAANTVGVGLTCFKRVCRNLGVRAWPFRFQDVLHNNKPSEEEDSSSQKMELPVVCVDDTVDRTVAANSKDDCQCELEEAEISKLLAYSKQVWGGEATSRTERDEGTGQIDAWFASSAETEGCHRSSEIAFPITQTRRQ